MFTVSNEISKAASTAVLFVVLYPGCSKDQPRSESPNATNSTYGSSGSTELPNNAIVTQSGSVVPKRKLATIPVEVSGKRGVLVSGDGVGWKPELSLLEEFEARFPETLKDDRERAHKVDKYFRQYWGKFEGNRRVLSVDFFEQAPDGISRGPVTMFDGFSSRASIQYYPDQKEFDGLEGGPPM